MTYDTQAAILGREPIVIVDIVLTTCGNTFGVAPCQGTGEPCFGTYQTCKSRSGADFSTSSTTYSFIQPSDTPFGLEYFPALREVSDAPTRIETGKGLSYRASVDVHLQDFPYHDRGLDPYWDHADRTLTPTGTFFGRLFSRNRFYTNRTLRVRRGWVTRPWNENNFETQSYIIDRIDVETQTGRIKIVAKDILSKLKDARCPTEDVFILKYAVNATDKALFIEPKTGGLTDAGFPAYIASGDYLPIPAGVTWFGIWPSFHVDCYLKDDATVYEWKTFTYGKWRVVDSVGDGSLISADMGGVSYGEEARFLVGSEVVQGTFNGTQIFPALRGVAGTTAEAHDAGSDISLCYWIENVHVMDVVYDLLVNYVGIPASMIGDYTTEKEIYMPFSLCSVTLTKPEPVNDLIGELCKAYMFDVWFDEREQVVKMRSSVPHVGNNIRTITDDHILRETLIRRDKFDDQATRVSYRYHIQNFAEDDDTNWQNEFIIAAPALETEFGWDKKKTVTIENRWTTSSSIAIPNATRYLERYQYGEMEIQFKIDASYQETVEEGGVYTFSFGSALPLGSSNASYGFSFPALATFGQDSGGYDFSVG